MSTYQPLPPEAKPSKPSTWWKKPIVWLPLAALVLGTIIGGAGSSKPTAAAPTPTVTVTATPAPAPTVTKTAEVTPASCVKALDLSEQGYSLAAEAMGHMGDALTAAGNFDVAAMRKANAGLDVLNPKMKELATPMRLASVFLVRKQTPMKAASTECRAGAK